MVAYHYSGITQRGSTFGNFKAKKFEWMQNKQSCIKSCGYEFEWKYHYDPRMSLTLKYFLALFTKEKKNPRNKDQHCNNEHP